MGLVDKLTELDQYIWTQHEKVTNYCNREYGWNKYDLARKTHACQIASFSAIPVYTSLQGIEGNNASMIIAGAALGLLTVGLHYSGRFRIKREEEKEIKLLERTGAVNEPQFSAFRPAWSLQWAAIFGYYTYTYATNQNTPPEGLALSSEEYNLFNSLMWASGFISNIFETSKQYFLDQIMTPPKKKKSVLKAIAEKVKGKLQAAPQPQLAPTKYQSIDRLVGDA